MFHGEATNCNFFIVSLETKNVKKVNYHLMYHHR